MARGTWQGSGTWKTTSGGGGLVLVIVAVLAGSGAASAIASAVVTIAIIIACTITAAVLAGIGVLVYRARQDRPEQPIVAPVVHQIPPARPPALEGSDKPAIEPPREIHLHFHGADPADVAALIHRIDRSNP